MEGWVKLHRKLLVSSMYKNLNAKQRDILITCLLKANHSENEWEYGGEIFKCLPGQFITSYQKLANECASDVKVQSVRTAMLKLEKWQFLTCQSTYQNTLVTICNWGTYQKRNTDTNTVPNEGLTQDQHSANKVLTTNKNDLNDKNDLNEKEEKSSIPFTDSERAKTATSIISDFFGITEMRQTKAFFAIGNFVRYQESKGDLDFLAEQFTAYKAVKSKEPKFTHNWETYIGDPAESYQNGAWNTKDWKKHPDLLEEKPAHKDSRDLNSLKQRTLEKAREMD